MPRVNTRQCVSQAILLAVTLLLRSARASTKLPEVCEQYKLLYEQVDEDFAFWDARGGISFQLMRETARAFVQPQKRGVHYGFFGGKAWMLTPSHFPRMGHAFLSRHLVYVNVLLDLERRWGAAIPDVEFVVVPTDTPNQKGMPPRTRSSSPSPPSPPPPKASDTTSSRLTTLGATSSDNGTHYPTLRFAKTAAFPSVLLVPHHDFYLLRYDTTVLNATADLNAALPWNRREPTLYGRYNMYISRHRDPADPTTLRLGSADVAICGGARGETCLVRRHFMGTVAEEAREVYGEAMDVRHEVGAGDFHASDLHTPQELWGRHWTVKQGHGGGQGPGQGQGQGQGQGHGPAAGSAGGGVGGGAGSGVAVEGVHNVDMGEEAHRAYVGTMARGGARAGAGAAGAGRAADGSGVRRAGVGRGRGRGEGGGAGGRGGAGGGDYELPGEGVGEEEAVSASSASVAHSRNLQQQHHHHHQQQQQQSANSQQPQQQWGALQEQLLKKYGPFPDRGQVQQGTHHHHHHHHRPQHPHALPLPGQQLPAYLFQAARHRALLHLDGRGLSSSLERLLALGSTVLVEESGYYGFYHMSLKPYVHYLPWWVRTPDDLMERVEWLSANTREAEAIAAAGQLFATTYLNSQARACYWLAVLQRLGRTLSYRPHLEDHPAAVRAEDFRDQGLLGIRRLPGQRALHGQPFEA